MAVASSAQTLTTLHTFNGTDGSDPVHVYLVQGVDGNFYGTTQQGGAHSHGTVFAMAPDGTLTTLFSFGNGGTDPQSPSAGLVLGDDGNFYGTTRSGGGSNAVGTAFKITPNGTITFLHSFTSATDGGGPDDGLIQATDGNFYGTTSVGGAHGGGTVFKMTPSGTVTVLYNFCSQNNGGNCTDGTDSETALVQGTDGNFYSVTHGGGANGFGVVYKVTPSGTYTVLHSFDFANDGGNPVGRLIQARDGNFYGTTYLGGVGDSGTVFRITPSGTLTTLYQFCTNLDCSQGSQPIAGVIQASDGNLYGITTAGGNGHGVIFRMTLSGTVTPLHAFCPQGNCSDGSTPAGGLLQANDGNFYGTTSSGGGHNGNGTVFRLTGPALIPTTTTLTTAPNPSHLNENVTMTATVHAQNGMTPGGNVFFYSDGVAIGIATLNGSGVGVLNYSGLSLGTHSIVAIYQGANGYAGSTSNTVQQVVQLPLSTTTVTSVPNPSTFGQQVTITATVGPSGPPTPTGTVSFTSNGTAISGCTGVPLVSQMAQCVTSSLAVGTDAIVATYSGDSNYTGSSGMLSQIVNPVPTAVQFIPVPPCRVVDTRRMNGTFGGPIIQGNTTRSFPLSEGDNPCSIPATAVAYSLNVTVVPAGGLGYLTIWPTGQGQPVVSTLNSTDGRVKANAAIVPAGTPSGAVSVYVTNTTHLILDIDGYFVPASAQTYQFYALPPCRIIDTRGTNGLLGGPFLHGGRDDGTHRDFPVLSGPCFPPDVNIAAYSMNFTVVPHTVGQPLGYLTVWPQGGSQPVVSTLNNPTATVVANAAIVPAGTNGGISVFAYDDTDLVVDTNGYFAPPARGGLSLYTSTPCRVYDSRANNGQPFQGERTVDVVGSPCGPPSSAQAYVFNATVVPANGPMGYLTLWPDGQDQPQVSTLNAYDGLVTSNLAIVPTDNGSIDAYVDGLTHLILDISGYFAP